MGRDGWGGFGRRKPKHNHGGGRLGRFAIIAGVGLIVLCIMPWRFLLIAAAVALICAGAFLLMCD